MAKLNDKFQRQNLHTHNMYGKFTLGPKILQQKLIWCGVKQPFIQCCAWPTAQASLITYQDCFSAEYLRPRVLGLRWRFTNKHFYLGLFQCRYRDNI